MSYQYMYIVTRDVYEQTMQNKGECMSGDKIGGNVSQSQVNHIELKEGGKVTIKPNKDVVAHSTQNEEEREEDKRSFRGPGPILKRIRRSRPRQDHDEEDSEEEEEYVFPKEPPYTVAPSVSHPAPNHVGLQATPLTGDRGQQTTPPSSNPVGLQATPLTEDRGQQTTLLLPAM